MGNVTKAAVTDIYKRLLKTFGPQKWWPAQTRFEVIVGAILTQNTNWGNVEKALNNLKAKNLLTPKAFNSISFQRLASLIKPSGYFNVKSKRLKNFIIFLFKEYQGSLNKMAKEEFTVLRRNLLSINGIGPETADSILLYAFDRPVFVVDAYTKRIFYRHNIIERNDDYYMIQEKFMASLNCDVSLFNEYHALIVKVGKNYCKPKPLCEQCLLNDYRYSLTAKCSCCHRALPHSKDRHASKDGYLCGECRAISMI